MVSATLSPGSSGGDADVALHPERVLSIQYGPARARAALRVLLELDEQLAAVIAGDREPMLAQIRYTWWHERLTALDRSAPERIPVLQALAAEVLPLGVTGATLAEMIDGWEALLDDALPPDERLRRHGAARGGGLFAAIARCCGCAPAWTREAGAAWGAADAVLRGASAGAEDALRADLDRFARRRWPRAARCLGAMIHSALMDLTRGPATAGAPRRVARLAWHALTGR